MTIEEMIQQTVREALAEALADLKPQSNAKEQEGTEISLRGGRENVRERYRLD